MTFFETTLARPIAELIPFGGGAAFWKDDAGFDD